MKQQKDLSIAVVGVSKDMMKYGHRILRDLLREGYKVEGVNPKGGEILGKQIYRRLKDMDITPDLVITAVPPGVTEQIVEECMEQGIKEIWMQPGSASEAAVDKARSYGIIVTCDSCFMEMAGIW